MLYVKSSSFIWWRNHDSAFMDWMSFSLMSFMVRRFLRKKDSLKGRVYGNSIEETRIIFIKGCFGESVRIFNRLLLGISRNKNRFGQHTADKRQLDRRRMNYNQKSWLEIQLFSFTQQNIKVALLFSMLHTFSTNVSSPDTLSVSWHVESRIYIIWEVPKLRLLLLTDIL